MVAIWILLGAVILQGVLAKITADDARSRGHDERVWFVYVLIFGVLAILIYLLTRNDQRLPESERSDSNLEATLSQIGLYASSLIVGIFLSILVILTYQIDVSQISFGLVSFDPAFVSMALVPPVCVFIAQRYDLF